MSERFPNAELTEWRSRLLDLYPRLFPDAKPVLGADGHWLTSCGWPNVRDGWREVIERLCTRLDHVAARTGGSLAIQRIAEKYGDLTIGVATIGLTAEDQADVELAVDLAEARSGHLCEICGDRGVCWSGAGWFTTRCDQHGEGRRSHHEGDGVQVVHRWGAALVRTARRYDFETDTFVPAEPPCEETA